jgi:biotin operon repressor
MKSMREISNAKRLMTIRAILFTETDESHGLSLKKIMDQLQLHFGSNYQVSKNSVKSTINELKDSGFHIEEQVGNDKTVYYTAINTEILKFTNSDY